jgi:hypothetical protein
VRNLGPQKCEISRLEWLHIFANKSKTNTRFDPCELEVVVPMPRRREARCLKPQKSKGCRWVRYVFSDNPHHRILPRTG